MHRIVLLSFLAVGGGLLAACLPLDLYYREGVSVARMQADQTQCEVRALRDAPVASQIRRRPPVYVPPERVCDAQANCVTRPGYWVEGEIFTVDVNADLRARVADQCMIARGYRATTIPACPQSVANAAPPAATRILPPLSGNSCVIRNRGGTWQIVTRG